MALIECSKGCFPAPLYRNYPLDHCLVISLELWVIADWMFEAWLLEIFLLISLKEKRNILTTFGASSTGMCAQIDYKRTIL